MAELPKNAVNISDQDDSSNSPTTPVNRSIDVMKVKANRGALGLGIRFKGAASANTPPNVATKSDHGLECSVSRKKLLPSSLRPFPNSGIWKMKKLKPSCVNGPLSMRPIRKSSSFAASLSRYEYRTTLGTTCGSRSRNPRLLFHSQLPAREELPGRNALAR